MTTYRFSENQHVNHARQNLSRANGLVEALAARRRKGEEEEGDLAAEALSFSVCALAHALLAQNEDAE